jgi:vitamin B12 transporter
MKPLPLAALFGLAAILGVASRGAQAQVMLPANTPRPFDPIVVTANRTLEPGLTLRDAVVITREELEAAGALSLAEVLQRRAGIEVRATGGPGQPQGIFIRGAGSGHTLVLIDGLRAGSATVGTTSIENIPLEMIERVEVVKGPMSSLYGSDAIGGVVQIFTRGKDVPHFFGAGAYGTDNDFRLSSGVATAEGGTRLAFSAGARKVDAPSATTDRVPYGHDPDGDPYENAFANFRASQRLWQGEVLALEAFYSRSRTNFDGGSPDDRNDQTIAGARFTSSSQVTRDWSSRLAIGQGRDKTEFRGAFPSRFETRQDQYSWINEVKIPGGAFVAGWEMLAQKVLSDTAFAVDERETQSVFASIQQAWDQQRLEASVRRDDDDQFGERNTGSVGYGMGWAGVGMLSATFARGFKAPTFFDLYGPASDFFQPNPLLRPEKSESREISLRGDPVWGVRWKVTAFDNQIEDLVTYVFPTVVNVNRARIRGVEIGLQGEAWGWRWSATATGQRPRDEATGAQLQGRAERFGTAEASRRYGAWTVGFTVHATGERYDSPNQDPATLLPAYFVADARVAYRLNKFWSAELAANNLFDRKYETAIGYEGRRRGVLLSVRFDAF